MICPIHRCEVRQTGGELYDCPACVTLWPAELLKEHQPLSAAERLARRLAAQAAKRRPGEDALIEWMRNKGRPVGVSEVARGAWYRWRDRPTRELPTWPEGRHGARAWLRRLEAQGRIERTADGWRAKETTT